MKRNWREVCFILPSIALAFAAVVGFQRNVPVFLAITYPKENITEVAEGTEEPSAPEGEEKKTALTKHRDFSEKELKKVNYAGDNTWKDGIYTGSGTGFGGDIKVRVTIADGKITDIQIISCEGETPSYFKQAKAVIQQIIAAQSPDVDMISGATYSSNGIRAAVIEALNKAEGTWQAKTVSAVKNKDARTKEKNDSVPNVLLPDDISDTNTVRDGVYTVSGICEPDERNAFKAYSLTADVTFLDGKCTSIANFSSTDESNKSYYVKAANGTAKIPGIVPQILEKQSASGISAVSGATCSSKTIRSLYLQAYSQAAGGVREESEDDSDLAPAQTPKPSPSAVPVQTPSGSGVSDGTGVLIKDGTYTASAMVMADEWEEFEDYNLTADVIFSEGKLVGITNLVPGDITNQWYCNSAANGYGSNTGIIRQLIDRQNGSVDAVSGATCSSMALVQIYKNALEMAMQ